MLTNKTFNPETGDYSLTVTGNIKNTVDATKYAEDGGTGGTPGAPEKTFKAGDDMPDAEARRERACLHDTAKQLQDLAPLAGKAPAQARQELIDKNNEELARLDALLANRE